MNLSAKWHWLQAQREEDPVGFWLFTGWLALVVAVLLVVIVSILSPDVTERSGAAIPILGERCFVFPADWTPMTRAYSGSRLIYICQNGKGVYRECTPQFVDCDQ